VGGKPQDDGVVMVHLLQLAKYLLQSVVQTLAYT